MREREEGAEKRKVPLEGWMSGLRSGFVLFIMAEESRGEKQRRRVCCMCALKAPTLKVESVSEVTCKQTQTLSERRRERRE